MLPKLERIKGIHPGAILKRELKKRGIKSIDLAKDIDEHPQTINAITKERRGINAKLSFKLGDYFNISNEYFMMLQAAHEVEVYRKSQTESTNPLLGKFRKSIFWDTKIELIDYNKNRRSVIQRILERGNKKEIKSLIKIYSLPTIRKELANIEYSFVPKYEENVNKYIKNEV